MTQAVSNISQQSVSGATLQQSVSENSSASKDEFLKLLTMQLKAQNPMKPYDNQEFAAQLAQFSQLEQLTGIKSLLEEQITMNQILTQTMANSALPGLLGKNAKASADSIHFDGETQVPFGYNLQTQASSATVTIKDAAGNVIRTMQLSGVDLASGEHKLNWDGKDNNGNTVAEGNYSFTVSAAGSNGSSYTADTFTYGTIQAVRFKSEGTVIVLNGMEVTLDSILDVTT